ncbi:dUTP diphosphatase [Desulfoluna butyratoxydans]|uniref:Deoxyuridine 5'-triphosphate nucleotidohydrolase n=1 Tax=Desulfoluna butyratoxydans TaxID=231438 RepID=A0A4U8YJN7_9BACT|nr:dUTP diphosphatase [Desulfoluna butyratoxydans]VFQ43996.1 deoxyuridine triphosphate nucleotidohydrolase [Desulfoluna butyratoxydans]
MTDRPRVAFKRLDPQKNSDVPLPRYMTEEAAGMDIHAANEAPVTLAPGAVALIPTGFSMALPKGFEAQIRPRSGLAVKHGIGIVNAPGTIDSDYRGEVKVALINFGAEPFIINRNERIAQMIVTRVWQAEITVVDDLDATERGDGGFGHTGV